MSTFNLLLVYIISQTFNVPANRLELRFRPGDLYSKPALGDRFATKALLLKVRRPKWKNVALPVCYVHLPFIFCMSYYVTINKMHIHLTCKM